ncbi:hypothetical protein BJ742DRAFT_830023 [Cladochytrium replicatum]|nr:hypothetical protein BJ742DRAFT_830023 [Cladochytrium replicatum]
MATAIFPCNLAAVPVRLKLLRLKGRRKRLAQMMMLFIWYPYGYHYIGLVPTVVIMASPEVYVYLAAQRRVLKMASFTGRTRTLRDGVWKDLSTHDLVPGDVIEIRAANSQRTDTCLFEDDVNDEEDGWCGCACARRGGGERELVGL